MKKQALCAAFCLALCIALGGRAAASESGVTLEVNGAALESAVPVQIVHSTTYTNYWPIVQAFYPDATAVWEDGQAVVEAEGLSMHIRLGVNYMEANGRYLYVPDGIRTEDVEILVPVRVLAEALGVSVDWDSEMSVVSLECGEEGPVAILSGDEAYVADDVYWLSRIIFAESGNQPLEGKIAVGNVVLNRVADSRFPNSVYDVVFQQNQFTPARTGSINNEPNAESVIAAKLCLEGANTAGGSLYFINPNTSPNSWASRNRPYVATIGSHAFFG